MRQAVALWLAGEVLLNAGWLARLIPQLDAYAPATIVVIACRALATASQSACIGALVRRLPPALALTRWTFLASAALLTLELGFRAAPSNVFPSHRWPIVVAYWTVTAAAVTWTMLRSSARAFQERSPARDGSGPATLR